MKHTLTLAAALLLAAGSVTPSAWAKDAKQQVTVNIKGEEHNFDLDDLEDGETITLGKGEHQITLIREGDQLRVSHPALDALNEGDHNVLELQGEGSQTMDIELMTGPEAQKRMMFITEDGETHTLDNEQIEELEWIEGAEAEGEKVIVIQKHATSGDPDSGDVHVEKHVKVIKVEIDEEQ